MPWTKKTKWIAGGSAAVVAGGVAAWLLRPKTTTATTTPANTASEAPPTVTGLTATPGSTHVKLQWTAATGADGYQVVNAKTNTVIAASVSGTSYTVAGLTPSTAYTFGVAAVSTAGMQNPPTTVSTTTKAAAASPGVEGATPGYMGSSLAFKLQSPTATTLTWNTASGATYYKVLLPNGTLVATVTGTSYDLTGLTPGQTYTYHVVPCNANGCNLNQGPITFEQPTAVSQGSNPLTGQPSQVVTYTASDGQSVTVATTSNSGSYVAPAPYQVNDLGAVQAASSSNTNQAMQLENQIQAIQEGMAQTQAVLLGIEQDASQTSGSVQQMYLNEEPGLKSQIASDQAQIASLQAQLSALS